MTIEEVEMVREIAIWMGKTTYPNYHEDWNQIMKVVQRIAKLRGSTMVYVLTILEDHHAKSFIGSPHDLCIAAYNYIIQHSEEAIPLRAKHQYNGN